MSPPPVAGLLRELSLLPTENDLLELSKAKPLAGTPDSVAVIEAGATAISKIWTAGLGVGVTALWTSITAFWNEQTDPLRAVLFWVAAIVTAAAVLAIGYIVASDVRGRAAASVSTYEARARIAVSMIEATQRVHNPVVSSDDERTLAIAAMTVSNTSVPAEEETGWQAVACRTADAKVQYLLVKGLQHIWVDSAHVRATAAPLAPAPAGPSQQASGKHGRTTKALRNGSGT